MESSEWSQEFYKSVAIARREFMAKHGLSAAVHLFPYYSFLKTFCQNAKVLPIAGLLLLKEYDLSNGDTMPSESWDCLAIAAMEMMNDQIKW